MTNTHAGDWPRPTNWPYTPYPEWVWRDPYTWPPYPYVPQPFQPIQQPHTGWLCPRCGKVHAPWIQQCDCNNGTTWSGTGTTTSTFATGVTPDPSDK